MLNNFDTDTRQKEYINEISKSYGEGSNHKNIQGGYGNINTSWDGGVKKGCKPDMFFDDTHYRLPVFGEKDFLNNLNYCSQKIRYDEKTDKMKKEGIAACRNDDTFRAHFQKECYGAISKKDKEIRNDELKLANLNQCRDQSYHAHYPTTCNKIFGKEENRIRTGELKLKNLDKCKEVTYHSNYPEQCNKEFASYISGLGKLKKQETKAASEDVLRRTLQKNVKYTKTKPTLISKKKTQKQIASFEKKDVELTCLDILINSVFNQSVMDEGLKTTAIDNVQKGKITLKDYLALAFYYHGGPNQEAYDLTNSNNLISIIGRGKILKIMHLKPEQLKTSAELGQRECKDVYKDTILSLPVKITPQIKTMANFLKQKSPPIPAKLPPPLPPRPNIIST